jgi:hypothetical protein
MPFAHWSSFVAASTAFSLITRRKLLPSRSHPLFKGCPVAFRCEESFTPGGAITIAAPPPHPKNRETR